MHKCFSIWRGKSHRIKPDERRKYRENNLSEQSTEPTRTHLHYLEVVINHRLHWWKASSPANQALRQYCEFYSKPSWSNLSCIKVEVESAKSNLSKLHFRYHVSMWNGLRIGNYFFFKWKKIFKDRLTVRKNLANFKLAGLKIRWMKNNKWNNHIHTTVMKKGRNLNLASQGYNLYKIINLKVDNDSSQK